MLAQDVDDPGEQDINLVVLADYMAYFVDHEGVVVVSIGMFKNFLVVEVQIVDRRIQFVLLKIRT